jgi:hypothetical protein
MFSAAETEVHSSRKLTRTAKKCSTFQVIMAGDMMSAASRAQWLSLRY